MWENNIIRAKLNINHIIMLSKSVHQYGSFIFFFAASSLKYISERKKMKVLSAFLKAWIDINLETERI